MPEETKKQEAEVKKFEPVCPFHIRKPGPFVNPGELKMVNRLSKSVNVNKETMAVAPVVEQFDLDAEIQTYKDMCGLSYFKELLKQGKVDPSESHDDGKHAVDMRLMPQSKAEAARIADEASDQLADIARKLGVADGKKVSSEDLIDLLTKKVAENVARQEAAQPKGDN